MTKPFLDTGAKVLCHPIAKQRRLFSVTRLMPLLQATAFALTINQIAHASDIPGIDNDTIPLGTAYHSAEELFYGLQTVTGQIDESLGNTESEIQFDIDLGYQELLNRINGSLDAGIHYPTVSLDTGGKYASSNAADQYTGTYTMYIRLTTKKRMLVPFDDGEYKFTSAAFELANSFPTNRYATLGDEFVAGIEYGAYVMVHMKIDYRSAQDKQDLSGYLSVDANGIVNVDRELAQVDQKKKQSAKISISANQVGGSPIALTQFLPASLMQCTLDNPSPCFQVFANTSAYLKNDFPHQFSSLHDYSPIKLITIPYNQAGPELLALTPQENYSEISYLTSLSIKRLSDLWVTAVLDYRRANNILTYYGSELSPSDKNAITKIRDLAKSNGYLLAVTVTQCKHNILTDYCQIQEKDIYESQRLHTYDVNQLALN